MKKNFLFLASVLVTLSLIFAVSCNKDGDKDDNNGQEEPLLKIGQSYQGGKIAYIDSTGKHGLIAAPEDLTTTLGILWDDYDAGSGVIGIKYGTGKTNTAKIVQDIEARPEHPTNYAAKLCDDLVLNGYNDWFLPSKDELNILYQNKEVIGMFFTNFTSGYWSSSERSDVGIDDGRYVWYQNFENGGQYYGSKYDKARVRAVRYF